MANGPVVNPAVSLKVEKMTKVTPVDQIHLVRLSNFRRLGIVMPRVETTINALESTMTYTGYHQWNLQVVKSYGRGRDYEVSLKLTDRTVDTDWHLKVAMAFINSAGHLVNLSQWRNFQTAGKVHKFLYGSGKLENWADGDDLKLLIWFSSVRFTKILSGRRDESFEQQFGCSKEYFKTFQSTVKGDLFNADGFNGLQRYANPYHVSMETFERIFDFGWLPSCFNFCDSTTYWPLEDGLSGSFITFHSYAEWIRSRLAFYHVIRSTSGREFLLTVTPGDIAHEITLTTAHLDGRRFEVQYGFGSGMVDGFALGQEGSVEDVGRISSPRFIWDVMVVNNCVGFDVVIQDVGGSNSIFFLISTEGGAVGFSRELFANSDVIQDMLEFTKPNEHGYKSCEIHFDTDTLYLLRTFIIVDVNRLKVNLNPLCNQGGSISAVRSDEILLEVYSAADFFNLPDVEKKVESILGYKPQMPIPVRHRSATNHTN